MAIDTLLFSRIGSPLCHQYRLISRTGSHAAFRGAYLRVLTSGHPRSPASHRTVSRPQWPRRLKGVASSAGGPESSGRLMAEMSSVQALMDLTLPRFAMAEGPHQVHPLWSVTSESPASPAPSQIEPRRGEDSRSMWTCFHHHRTRSHWM